MYDIILVYVFTCFAYVGWIDTVNATFRALEKMGKMKKNEKAEVMETDSDIDNFVNGAVCAAPCVAWAYAHRSELSWSLDPYCLLYILAYLLLHDTWFFFAHKAEHKWKWLYNNIHLRHHEPKTLSVKLVSHGDTLDIILIAGIPFAVWTYVACHVIGNGTTWAIGMYDAMYFFLLSHCGYKPSMYYGIFNPTVLLMSFVPYSSTTSDHLVHHVAPTKNFGAFFSIWDRVFDSHRTYRNLVNKADIKKIVNEPVEVSKITKKYDTFKVVKAEVIVN